MRAIVTSKPFRGILLLLFTTMLALGIAGPALSQDRHALVAEVDGMINPVTQRYISRVVDRGERDGSEVVIIKLNTPGGLLDSTRKIVEDLLSDRVPTVVYVYPSGAQAASAGTFITAAANFAVMAPGTNIGAAAPVAGGGEDVPETLKSKVVEDTLALMRAIAEIRNRNAEALEDTITEPNPRSYDTRQAVDLKVVDFAAENISDLLRQIDGKTLKMESGPRTLDTRGLVLRDMKMNFIEKFLFFLADPNVSFILLSLGGLGLVVELFNPGLIFPGVTGVILLILAFLSFGNLPVNWAAVGLIILAAVLIIAEVFVAGFGVLGIMAIVSFIFGGLLLFSSFGVPSPTAPSMGVNLWLLGTFAGVFTLLGFWFLRTVVQSRRMERSARKALPSPLLGAVGMATEDLSPRGTVHIQDEEWTAVTEGDIFIGKGERVKVLKVEGTVLTVARPDE